MSSRLDRTACLSAVCFRGVGSFLQRFAYLTSDELDWLVNFSRFPIRSVGKYEVQQPVSDASHRIPMSATAVELLLAPIFEPPQIF